MRLVLAAAAALVLAWPGAAFAAKQPQPFIVHTSVSPAWSYFGDSVTLRLDVLFDPRVVDASSVLPATSFGNWQQLSPTQYAETRSGNLVHATWWFPLDCLTFACLPRGPIVQQYPLPPLTLKARGTDGRPIALVEKWPKLRVSARFLPPALPSARPAFRLQTAVPAASWRVGPSLLADLLEGAGALLLAGAAAAVGVVVWRRVSGRERHADRSALQRALALVRDSTGRDEEDRRRAVGLLARTLPPQDEFVASASKLAWSADEPSPARLEALAENVEAEVGKRS